MMGPKVFPKSVTKILPYSPMYCSGQSVCEHLYHLITLHFRHMLSLSLGAIIRVCMVLSPLKCTCMHKLLQIFLNFSLNPLMYGTTVKMFFLLETVLLVLLC